MRDIPQYDPDARGASDSPDPGPFTFEPVTPEPELYAMGSATGIHSGAYGYIPGDISWLPGEPRYPNQVTPPTFNWPAPDLWGPAPVLQHERVMYQHESIDEASIRLLCLLPEVDSAATITCNLQKVGLSEIRDLKLKYEALSYAWGGEEATKLIRLQEPGSTIVRSHHITPTLYSVLRRMRKPDRKVWLWVDSVCINQNDALEKSQQIPLMPDIYSNAWSVTIWLGEAEKAAGQHEEKLAMDFIPNILNLKLLDRLTDEDVRRADLRSWAAFAKILRRPWFQRRWVIQEVALGGRAAVRCGQKIINWLDFSDAISLFFIKLDKIRLLYDASDLSKADPDAFSHVESSGAQAMVNATNGVLRKAENGMILDRLWDLETLVNKFTSFETSNPRDTVYALLSLARNNTLDPDQTLNHSHVSNGLLIPNYVLHPVDCYIQFISYCITSSGSVDILCRHWAQNLKGVDMPSWIGTVDNSAFGTPSSFSGRINGDGLVGEPGSRVYNASRGLAPRVWLTSFAKLPAAKVVLCPGRRRHAYPEPLHVGHGQLYRSVQPSFVPTPLAIATSDDAASLKSFLHGVKRKRSNSEPSALSSVEMHDPVMTGSTRQLRKSMERRDSHGQHRALPGVDGDKNTAAPATKPDADGPLPERIYNGVLHIQGVVLAALHEVSPRVVDGTISDDCLRMLGWEHGDDVSSIPEQLWRTLVADRGAYGKNAPTWYKRACAFALTKTSPEGDLNTSKLIGNKALPESLIEYLKRVQNVVWSRRFFTAPRGLAFGSKGKDAEVLVGFGSRHIKRGDLLCALFGCSVPVVMRETADAAGGRVRRVRLLGECFVYGKMDGEIFAGMDWRAIQDHAVDFELS